MDVIWISLDSETLLGEKSDQVLMSVFYFAVGDASVVMVFHYDTLDTVEGFVRGKEKDFVFRAFTVHLH